MEVSKIVKIEDLSLEDSNHLCFQMGRIEQICKNFMKDFLGEQEIPIELWINRIEDIIINIKPMIK